MILKLFAAFGRSFFDDFLFNFEWQGLIIQRICFHTDAGCRDFCESLLPHGCRVRRPLSVAGFLYKSALLLSQGCRVRRPLSIAAVCVRVGCFRHSSVVEMHICWLPMEAVFSCSLFSRNHFEGVIFLLQLESVDSHVWFVKSIRRGRKTSVAMV